MILVDTSVWIDHFRSTNYYLKDYLKSGIVRIHWMVLGELSCGHVINREQRFRGLYEVPFLSESKHEKVIEMISSKQLIGRGIGYIDAHLLCTTLGNKGVLLWTFDVRLGNIADELGVLYRHPQANY